MRTRSLAATTSAGAKTTAFPRSSPARASPGSGRASPGRRNALLWSAIAWKPWTHLEDGLAETVAYLKGV